MTLFLWAGFLIFVGLMLALDIGAFHRKVHAVGLRESIIWTCVWAGLAMIFNAIVYFMYQQHWLGIGSGLNGAEAAGEFFTAWLVEKSLSLDNIFVFALIFSYFKVPLKYQHRVLFWGIIGALVLRGVMIAAGVALMQRFEFMNYIFAAMLLYAAIKMAFFDEKSFDPSKNILFRAMRRLYPLSDKIESEHFFTVLENGKRAMTPLFLVLIVVESTDVLFAFDSIPAVFGITRDPFLVFTSNIFAILGLRALYFVLSAMLTKFERLKTSLITVLIYIAIKMFLDKVLPVPTMVSLLIVSVLLVGGVLASVVENRRRGINA
jgi:tellurite resistance protein TerC